MKMKFSIKLIGVLLAALALVAFSACEALEAGPYEMGKDAALVSLQIGVGGAAVFLPDHNFPTEDLYKEIPAPIDVEDWEDYDYDMTEMKSTTLQFQRASDIVNVRIYADTGTGDTKNARVEWGVGDFITRPVVFQDVRVPATFYHNDYLYLKVTPENANLSRIKYYRFLVRVWNSGINLASINFDSKKKDDENNPIIKAILPADDGPTWQEAAEGNMALSLTQSQNIELIAKGFEDTSTFKFAVVPAAGDAPDLTTEPTNFTSTTSSTWTTTLYDQDMLYVEVTAQNGVDMAYYKFIVSVGRIANIEKLEFKDGATLYEVTDLGAANATWTQVRKGGFATADPPAGGYGIELVLEDDEASVTWQVVKPTTAGGAIAEPASFPATGAATVTFVNTLDGIKDVLAIKVISKNTKVTRFYLIEVSILPANILVQPRSAVYYYFMPQTGGVETLPNNGDFVVPSPAGCAAGDPEYNGQSGSTTVTGVEPLYVVMDRPGTYTYQWYECNSWYGGYLFDRDGHTRKPGTTDLETNFSGDAYHSGVADEKANISLFNGGNQEARYIIPGRAISGATSATYTPKIAYRPFLPSYTYESHYYWVEVTDSNGYKMTSERATIVSERNSKKKHLIVDVNNYFDNLDTIDLSQSTTITYNDVKNHKILFKNTRPFQVKYEKFRIPLEPLYKWYKSENSGTEFDVINYTIMSAQAKFYLKDGVPWIQNWTNGNLSFENSSRDWDPDALDADGKPVTGADPVGHPDEEGDWVYTDEILVLFYNLTNNGATYLLQSDSKEPEGKPLGVKPEEARPTYIVVEPSGDHTKGPNKDGYPALDANGKAASSIVGTDLQGWFCGYVELCELRFEGPARSR